MQVKKIAHFSLITLGLGFFGIFGAGCASITRGMNDVLVVESTPSNAKATLSTGQSQTTPARFRLRRDTELSVTIEKEGYKPSIIHVTHQTAGAGAVAMAGNVLAGGIIGAGVDYMTGATQNLTPNPVRVTLDPLSGESS